ncbi:MAG: transposase [Boseongicola sp. SB0667_bin_21]|nr:transposase [Boseongicola sp. SB0667_bin_21]
MTKRHRRHSTAKKREVVEAYLNGEALQALSRRHDVCRSLIRIWIEKYERGSYDDDAVEADLLSNRKGALHLVNENATVLVRVHAPRQGAWVLDPAGLWAAGPHRSRPCRLRRS